MPARAMIALFLVTSFATASFALADDPARLKEAYDDAIKQLQVAQDRKNELANENEQLKTRLAQLQADLDRANQQFSGLRDQTYRLRHEAAALDQFLSSDLKRWSDWSRQFNRLPTVDREPRLLIDRDEDWPFSAVVGG